MNDIKKCEIEAVMKDWMKIRDRLNASGLDFVESPAYVKDGDQFKIFIWFDYSFDRIANLTKEIGGEYIEDGRRVV